MRRLIPRLWRLCNVYVFKFKFLLQMAYASGKGMLREQLEGVLDTSCSSLDGVEAALGMAEEKIESTDHGDPADW